RWRSQTHTLPPWRPWGSASDGRTAAHSSGVGRAAHAGADTAGLPPGAGGRAAAFDPRLDAVRPGPGRLPGHLGPFGRGGRGGTRGGPPAGDGGERDAAPRTGRLCLLRPVTAVVRGGAPPAAHPAAPPARRGAAPPPGRP